MGTIAGSSEEVDDLLVSLEESTVCVGTRWSLEESMVCAGIGWTMIGDEVQVQAQQGSAKLLDLGLLSMASGGFWPQVEH